MSDDFIRRSDAIEHLKRWFHSKGWMVSDEDCKSILWNIPSADRPQGEWIHNPNGIDRDFIWWKCSECGHVIYSESEHDRQEFHAFCGRCGARMKGADDEH